MPKANSNRKSNPTRRNRKWQRRPRKQQIETINPSLSIAKNKKTDIVADKTFVKLKYVDKRRLSGGVLVTRNYLYNANSLFDPDRTGAGHQPLGFDQWKTFYNRYRVYRCDFVVRFMSNLTSDVPMVVCCVASNDTGGFSDLQSALEQARTTTFKLTGSQVPTVMLKGSIDLPALNGKTREQYRTDDLTESLVSTSPSETLCLDVLVESIDGVSVPDIYYCIELVYHAEFFDRIDLIGS